MSLTAAQQIVADEYGLTETQIDDIGTTITGYAIRSSTMLRILVRRRLEVYADTAAKWTQLQNTAALYNLKFDKFITALRNQLYIDNWWDASWQVSATQQFWGSESVGN